MKNSYFLIVTILLLSFQGVSQIIRYSEIEKEDNRGMDFEIVGKFNNNSIVVYKNYKTDHFLSVYDLNMKLKDKIVMKNMPYNIINTQFVAYATHFYMIYTYQKRSVVYCEAIKFDNNAKKMEETIELDTTSISLTQNNRIYNTLVSDNKQQIAILKVNRKNDRVHAIGISLFNKDLQKQYKRLYNINVEGRFNFIDQFTIDNDGDVFFAKCFSVNGGDFLNKLSIMHIPLAKDSLLEFPVKSDEKVLDEIIFKADNVNKRIIMQSFYYTKRKGNVEGHFVNFFNKLNPTVSTPMFTKYSDSLRLNAKGFNNQKIAFDDFFIRQIFPKVDGGFIVTAESYYSFERGNATDWSRSGYFNSNAAFYSTYDYYLMNRNFYDYDRFNNNSKTYNAESIAVLSFAKNGILEWSQIVDKSQREEGNDNFLSFQTILTGGSLHFLYNDKRRNSFIMNDVSVAPDGKLTRNPTVKNLNNNFVIMPRHGKQISAREMIFPCEYRNYITFAKLEY